MTTTLSPAATPHAPWNKGKLVGQKPPLKLWEIWTVRTCLCMAGKTRDLALFNLAIDSKLRGCDLVSLHVRDVVHGNHILARANVVQHKTLLQLVQEGRTEDAIGYLESISTGFVG